MKRPTVGIATDGAHSTKERLKILNDRQVSLKLQTIYKSKWICF